MFEVKDDTHTSGSHFNELCVEDFRAAIVSAMSDTFLIKMQNEGFCCFHGFILILGYKTTLNSFSNGSSPFFPFFLKINNSRKFLADKTLNNKLICFSFHLT